MTSLDPGYGETPLDGDELSELLPEAREALPSEPTKADVYALEQAFESAVTEDVIGAVLDGMLDVDDVATDGYLRSLHARL